MFSPTTKDAAANAFNNSQKALDGAKDDLRSTSCSIQDDISAAAAHAGAEVRSLINMASEQIGETSKRISHEVQTNPMRSTLLAIGLGFFVGMIFRRF